MDPDISIALQYGTSLLRLSDTFKRESLLPLGEVLKQDTTIRILDFRRTCIYSSGCYVLQSVLKQNSTLEGRLLLLSSVLKAVVVATVYAHAIISNPWI